MQNKNSIVHVLPVQSRESNASDAGSSSEDELDPPAPAVVDDSLAGLHVNYSFHVPRSATDYPHEAFVRLLGQHVRLCEHGPLGIKPLKNMIKTFYWRVIRGLELPPKEPSLTTFPLWLHANADVGDWYVIFLKKKCS